MLYILASDILGPRPLDAGSCGEKVADDGSPITYAVVEPLLLAGHEFLLELENVWTFRVPGAASLEDKITGAQRIALSYEGGLAASDNGAGDAGPSQPLGWQDEPPIMWQEAGGTPLSQMQLGSRLSSPKAASSPLFGVAPDPFGPPDTAPPLAGGGLKPGGYLYPTAPGYGGGMLGNRPSQLQPTNVQPWQVLDSALVFCIPDNEELLALWERVAHAGSVRSGHRSASARADRGRGVDARGGPQRHIGQCPALSLFCTSRQGARAYRNHAGVRVRFAERAGEA
jgi:hypothetical protein